MSYSPLMSYSPAENDERHRVIPPGSRTKLRDPGMGAYCLYPSQLSDDLLQSVAGTFKSTAALQLPNLPCRCTARNVDVNIKVIESVRRG